MSARSRPTRHTARVRRRGGAAGVSPRALYARPMALRRLYTDAGSVARTGQWDVVVAHRQNSR